MRCFPTSTIGLIVPFILIIYLPIISFGQNSTLDSLNHRLESVGGRDRVDVLNAVSFQYLIIDLNKSYELIQNTKKEADRIDYPLGKAQAEIYEGLYFNLRGEKKKAIQLLQKAAKMPVNLGIADGKAMH